MANLSDPHPNQVEADDEATLDGIVSEQSGYSSRHASQQASEGAPIKVLTRPVSSGEDPAAGFSFTRAKPMQQLDFRRRKQTPVAIAAQQEPSPMHHDPSLVEDPTSPTPNTTSGPRHRNSSSALAPPNSNLNRSNVLNITFPTHSKPAMTALASDYGPEYVHNRSGKAPGDPLRFVAGAPKITKSSQKRAKTRPVTDAPPPPKTAYTEDDLLKLLMYRRRQGQQELEYLRATQHQKEAEIQKLHEDSQRLVEQERIKYQQLQDVARLRVEALKQTVQNQSSQLRSDEDSLMAERGRSNRLEDQISTITASHGQLLELFTGHRDTINGKIDDLLHQAQSIVPSDKALESDAHDPIRSMLEQCVGMLEKLHKANTVKPEDLQKLSDIMNIFGEGYVPFLWRNMRADLKPGSLVPSKHARKVLTRWK